MKKPREGHPQEPGSRKEKGEPKPASFQIHSWISIRKCGNCDYLCEGVTVADCCRRNSSSVSLGTFTCWPLVRTWTPAPAAEPTPAPIAAPLPPPAIAPMMAPAIAPPPTFFAVFDPRPFPCKL